MTSLLHASRARSILSALVVVMLLAAVGLPRSLGQLPTNDAAGSTSGDSIGEFPNVATLDPYRYREIVSTAHQAMKLVYAPLNEEQKAAIDKAWAPAYGFTCPALIDYLQALLPLVEQFLSSHGQASILAPQFDAAYREALIFNAINDPVSAEEALAVAWAKQRQLQHELSVMNSTAEEIRKLGDPPDPGSCRAKRRQQHDESVRAFGRRPVARPAEPAWVLTRHDVEWTISPHEGRFLSGNDREGWADEWTWRKEQDGTSITSLLRTKWRHQYTTGHYDDAARWVEEKHVGNGFVQSRIRLAWAHPPTVQTFVPDERVSKSSFMHIPFVVEDADQAEKKPFLDTDDKQMPAPEGGRRLDQSFVAFLVAPDGKRVEDYGGYLDMTVDRQAWLKEKPRIAGTAQVQFRFDPEWWRIVYERNVGKWNEEWTKRKPGENWKILATLTITQRMEGNAPMPGKTEGEYDSGENLARLKITWEYTFDPVGGTVQPIDLSNIPDRYREQVKPVTAGDATRAAEEAEARKQMIEFHQSNIRICEQNIAKWKSELDDATDPRVREQLLHTLMHAQHTRFAEMDRIRELQTGELVHTRTPIDEWYAARFVQQVRDRMDPSTRLRRYAEGTQRMIRLAPPEQREQLAAFVAKHTADVQAWGDVTRMKKISRIVFEKVQGHWEGVSAWETENALIAEQRLQYAQALKHVAEAEMFVASMGLSSAWSMPLFEGCVGFAGAEDGGLGQRAFEGIKNALAWTNAAGLAASQAMEGYVKGGWIAGEPGWTGALERGVATFAAVKGAEYAIGKLLGMPPATQKPDVKQAFEEARFRIAMEDSRQLVKDYQRMYDEYRRALEFGASGPEIQAMERALRDRVTLLHSSYEGKLVLKSLSRDASYAHVIADYNQRLHQVHQEVQAAFRRTMSERGYEAVDQWVLREFRNASSAGTVGMDYDIGLMRQFLDPSSPHSRGLSEIPFIRNGLRVNQAQLQADAQAAWNSAYHAVTGRSAKSSFEALTTAAHPEIYTDLAWLGNESIRHVNIGQLVASKAGQAGDVTAYKVAEMMHDANLLPVSRMIESARGMSKDIQTKLLPLIDEAGRRSPQAADRFRKFHSHWRDLARALDNAPTNPGLANEQVRLLTGGKDIPELALDLRDMIASYGKALGN